MDAWRFANVACRDLGFHYMEHGDGHLMGLYASVSALSQFEERRIFGQSSFS